MTCPACRHLPNTPSCGWCKGRRTIPLSEAARYAEWVHTHAVGELIANRNTLEDVARARGQSEAITAEIAGLKALWRSSHGGVHGLGA